MGINIRIKLILNVQIIIKIKIKIINLNYLNKYLRLIIYFGEKWKKITSISFQYFFYFYLH